jgi:AraC family transcriptional regulator
MDVEIREVPPHRMACFPHRGSYRHIGRDFEALTSWIHTSDAPKGLIVGVYYDDPPGTPETERRSAAGMVVPDDYSNDDERVEIIDFRAGTYAVAVHKGSYDGLPQAWEDLTGKWLPESGYEHGDGPRFEAYLDAEDDQFLTELWLPVKTS